MGQDCVLNTACFGSKPAGANTWDAAAVTTIAACRFVQHETSKGIENKQVLT